MKQSDKTPFSDKGDGFLILRLDEKRDTRLSLITRPTVNYTPSTVWVGVSKKTCRFSEELH